MKIMQFHHIFDLNLPLVSAHHLMCDYVLWEDVARQKGLTVDTPTAMQWNIYVPHRKRERKIDVYLENSAWPNAPGTPLIFVWSSPLFQGKFSLSPVPLDPEKTQMRASLTVQPRTISASVFLRVASLAKNSLDARFRTRMSLFKSIIEKKYTTH